MKLKFFVFIAIFTLLPTGLFGQEIYQEYQGTFKGKVLEVVSEEVKEVPGTGTESVFQVIRAEFLDGDEKGKTFTFEHDYFELDEGDKFYFNYYVDVNGRERFGITNVDRKDSLLLLLAVFILTVIAFGGRQGVRSLLALFGSFLAIFYILLPGLINGWNPLVTSSLVASGILFVAIFFTHGFNRESLVAYGGTMLAVILTGLFAVFSVGITDLSGFGSEESVYLNLNTGGALDFVSLLIGAIIIGVLGVLDDIAVTQSAIVSELYGSNPAMTSREVYKRAIRVGREHVSALVNTLVLAYTGTALPLLLYFYTDTSSISTIINTELVATEIVRAIVGSLGLILTVPIVTLLAVYYLKGYKSKHSHSHTHIH